MKKVFISGILKLSIVFCSALFTVGGYVNDNYIANYTVEKQVSQKEEIKEQTVKKEVEQEAVPVIEEDLVVVEEDNSSLVTVSTPEVPEVLENRIQVGNVISNSLMKDNDGSNFYLNHNINGIYDGRGVPYIDFRTDPGDRKAIIYSHSSTSGNGPFQNLQNYHYNKGYYDANRYITINYEGNTYTYEIFSVYVSLADSEDSEGLEYFHNMSYSNDEWAETIQKYKNNSEYDTGVQVSGNDRIIILQTCSMDPNYYEQYYRYNLLIMGKLI